MDIEVIVANKIATTSGSPVIVCGNNDYVITFLFDEEWNEYEVKTARFMYIKDGKLGFVDEPFAGNVCPVPVLSNIDRVDVGIYAGDLRTTTAAVIKCKKSILCKGGTPDEPEEDVYCKIMELLNENTNNANAIKILTEEVNLWELETGIYYLEGGFKYTSTSGVGGAKHIVIIYRPQPSKKAVRYIHFCGGSSSGSWNSIDCGYTNGTTNEQYKILDTSSGYTKKEVDTLLETLKTELQGDIEDISALVGGAE